MKSLATLIKLQKTRVDEQRLHLARIEEHLAQIEQAIRDLNEQKKREQVAAKKDTANAVTYGAFLKRTIRRGRELDKERLVAIEAVRLARERLAELFEEQKRYELAQQHRDEQARREESRRLTIELDEIGGITHQRRKS